MVVYNMEHIRVYSVLCLQIMLGHTHVHGGFANPDLIRILCTRSRIQIHWKLNSLSATGDRGRQPPLLPPLLGATRVDTIIHNYRLSAPP